MTSPQQQVWQVKFLIIGGVKIYDFLFITSNETNFLWFPSILHNYGIKMTQSTSTNDRVIKKNSPYSFVSIWQLIHSVHYSWIPWNLSFRYTFIHEKKQQPTFTVLQWCTAWIPWNLSFRYNHNSHQRWNGPVLTQISLCSDSSICLHSQVRSFGPPWNEVHSSFKFFFTQATICGMECKKLLQEYIQKY